MSARRNAQMGIKMILLLYLLAAGGFFLLGRGALTILYKGQKDRELYWEDNFLTGAILCIGLAEAAHLGALFLHRTFSDCVKLFVLLSALALVVAVVLELWQGRRRKPMLRERSKGGINKISSQIWTRGEQIVFALFFLLVLWQIITIVMEGYVQLQRDMTVETVNSFLSVDAIYQVNPLTGQPYELGIPSRLKILCLPTLYGILCKVFGLSAIEVVWRVIPVITLLLSYMAYSLLARRLFQESRLKRGLFLIFTALLFLVGDYAYGMDGFGLLHGGFLGVTIRGTVLVPYVIGLVLRRKWKMVLLCIFAEACIVWTLYGLGACIFVAAGLFVLEQLLKWFKKRKSGKEEAACGSL